MTGSVSWRDARPPEMRSDGAAGARAASPAATPDPDPAALFARAFAPGRLAELLGLAPDALPLTLLERATLAPVAAFLRRGGKRLRGRLVAIGWQLGGADGPPPHALIGMIELLHAGSMVIDDIEDGSTHRRGAPALHTVCGLPQALNTGNLLYFLPLLLLDELALPRRRARAVQRAIARTLVRAHCGQAIDLATRLPALTQADVPGVVRALSRLKTGSLMALAASLGARCASAPVAHSTALARFGRAFGVALQMRDDLANLDPRHDPHKFGEDLRLGRATWVWAWLASRLAPPAFAALQRELAAVAAGDGDPAVLAARLRAALGPDAAAPARAHLRRARAALRRAIGPPAGNGHDHRGARDRPSPPADAFAALDALCAPLEGRDG